MKTSCSAIDFYINWTYMATIEIMIDTDKDLTVFEVRGDLTAEEIMRYSSEYYQTRPTKLVLWDCSSGSVKNITSKEFRQIAEKMKKIAEKRVGGKTAFVGDVTADFGMGRMYEAFAEIEGLPVEYRTFKNLEDARKWLGVE